MNKMSIRDRRLFRLAIVAGSLFVSGMLAWAGEAQQASGAAPAPPETAEAPKAVPRPSEIHKDGLQRLEEQLARALQIFAPKDGPDSWLAPGPRPPPARPVVPTRRLQERLDQEQNWILFTPEDVAKTPETEEMFGLSEREKDQRERTKASALERLYEKLGRGPEDERSKDQEFEALLNNARLAAAEEQQREKEREEKTPESVREREEALRRLLTADDYSSPAGSGERRVFESFDLGKPSSGRDELREPNRYVQQFREFFDGGSVAAAPAGPLAPVKPNLGSTLASPLYAPRMDSLIAPPQRSTVPSPSVNSTFSLPAAPDVNRQAVNDWNPYYTPPTVETKRFTPPRPNFEAPRRNF